MIVENLDFSKPDLRMLAVSITAFLAAFLPPTLLETLFGNYTIFMKPWIYIGVGFHEVGHLFFAVIIKPIFLVTGFLAFMGEPIVYLGGFLFNAIAGVVLLWFSLWLQKRLSIGKIRKGQGPAAFSFLFIAYINLLLLPYTLTHLQHVVGKGLDFTTTAILLNISLNEVVFWMWVVTIISFVLAVFFNLLFVFEKRLVFRASL